MIGLRSNFGTELVFVVVALLGASVAALVALARAHRAGTARPAAASKALFPGALVATVVATALPRRLAIETDGDLVLRLGGAGLNDWQSLGDQPLSLGSVVFVGNILIYAVIALTFVVGWNRLRHYAVPLCAGVSIGIETVQYLALGRVAAIDDVVLNVSGASLGWLIGIAVGRRQSTVGNALQHVALDQGNASTMNAGQRSQSADEPKPMTSTVTSPSTATTV